MAKVRLKKKAKISLIATLVIIVMVIIANIGINKYNEYLYHQTYEYKLLEHGYTESDVKTILDNFTDDSDLEYLLSQEKNDNYVSLLNEKYYLAKNFYSYIEYMNNNESLDLTTVVRNINIHLDKDFYETNYETNENLNELMLVNKYYLLSSEYAPDDLVSFSQDYTWGEAGSKKCLRVAYDAFLDLWSAAKDAGFYLMINSAYRSYANQETLYNNYKDSRGEKYADSIAARPGASEHQTGLSLDIFSKDAPTRETFKNSEAFEWLKNNAHKYGFILRYPEGLEDVTGYSYEAWHYRYVGTQAATYIYENNITYEEYYAYFIEK